MKREMPMTRDRAMAALRNLEMFMDTVQDHASGEARTLIEEISRERILIEQTTKAMILGLVSDEPVPAKMFKEWASVRRITDWRDAGKLKVEIIHNRCCVRPSDFFAYWRTLKE